MPPVVVYASRCRLRLCYQHNTTFQARQTELRANPSAQSYRGPIFVTYPSDRLDGTEVTAVLIAYFDCLLKAIADHEARQIAMRREQPFLTTSSTLLSLAVVASPLKSKNRQSADRASLLN